MMMMMMIIIIIIIPVFYFFNCVSYEVSQQRFSPLHRVQTGSGAHPVSYPMGTVLRRESDHSSPYSTEVKNEWSYTSIPSYVSTETYIGKHGGTLKLQACAPELRLVISSRIRQFSVCGKR